MSAHAILYVVKCITISSKDYVISCRWTLIAGRLPGRTANDIKNYWNTRLLRS